MASKVFHFFSDLPPELRAMIWEMASNVGRNINIFCDDRTLNLKLKIPNPMPGVLLASTESREEALRFYDTMTTVPPNQDNPDPRGKFYANSAQDSFHFKLSTSRHRPGKCNMRIQYCLIRLSIDVEVIKEFTVGLSMSKHVRDLTSCIRYLLGLRKLSIIYDSEHEDTATSPSDFNYPEICRFRISGHLICDWTEEQRYISSHRQFKILQQEYLVTALRISNLEIRVILETVLTSPEQTV